MSRLLRLPKASVRCARLGKLPGCFSRTDIGHRAVTVLPQQARTLRSSRLQHNSWSCSHHEFDRRRGCLAPAVSRAGAPRPCECSRGDRKRWLQATVSLAAAPHRASTSDTDRPENGAGAARGAVMETSDEPSSGGNRRLPTSVELRRLAELASDESRNIAMALGGCLALATRPSLLQVITRQLHRAAPPPFPFDPLPDRVAPPLETIVLVGCVYDPSW